MSDESRCLFCFIEVGPDRYCSGCGNLICCTCSTETDLEPVHVPEEHLDKNLELVDLTPENNEPEQALTQQEYVEDLSDDEMDDDAFFDDVDDDDDIDRY